MDRDEALSGESRVLPRVRDVDGAAEVHGLDRGLMLA